MSKTWRQDITEVVNQNLCHSCGSCFSACGDDSISYHETIGGHIFPKIDANTCTHCGLCYDVCPGDHFLDILKLKTKADPFIGEVKSIFTGYSTDNIIYKNSQSGGIATAILKYLFESKQISAAIVTTMTTSSSPHSEAILIHSASELLQTQKSKYTPTTINSLMPEVAKIDGNIAMVGLSCHMHGLENLIKIKRKLKNKIIKIGLICDRVMTHASIDFLSQMATKDEIKNFVFRDTSNTPYPGDISVTTSQGKRYVLPKENRMIMKDFFTPVRCRLCFDKMNIYSDIVVGDPHGVSNVNRSEGESLVLARTLKGQNILDGAININDINVKEVSLQEAIKGQHISWKRKQWYTYYLAWEKMGYDLPDYPKEVFKNAIMPTKKEIIKAKKDLKHALSLDSYKSRKKLLRVANRYYKYQLFRNRFFKYLYLLKKSIKESIKWLFK